VQVETKRRVFGGRLQGVVASCASPIEGRKTNRLVGVKVPQCIEVSKACATDCAFRVVLVQLSCPIHLLVSYVERRLTAQPCETG
jgi:hypothetical protein